MGVDVKVTNNVQKFANAAPQAAVKALEACGLQGEDYAKKACPVDTGALRNSITHEVDEDNYEVYIGTDQEYAAYVELGTGIYYPGGRKTPWVYKDPKTGEFRMTRGHEAKPYLKPAVAEHGSVYNQIIERYFRNA